MNTKKLIGTILGVIMFAALIAGATFAWLTFGVTIGENVLAGNTVNFVIDYTNGSAITTLPILDSNLAKPTAVGAALGNNNASVTAIVIKKPHVDSDGDETNEQPDGHASIWLKTTTTTQLSRDGVVRWAVCRDPQVEATGNQVDNVCGSITDFNAGYAAGLVLNMGLVDVDDGDTIPLLSDARYAENPSGKGATLTGNCSTTSGISMCTGTSTELKMLEEDGVSYFIYFWLDGELINNDHLKDQYDRDPETGEPVDDEIKYNLYSGYVFASATQLYK